MEQNRPGFSAEHRADNDNRKAKTSTPISSSAPTQPKQLTARQRWNAFQLTKTTAAWLCVAMIIGTMVVGFTWGGWVTTNTSVRNANTVAHDAVIERLATICVAQFEQDAAKAEKLVAFQAVTDYQQRNFVRDQGWATMPGDEQSSTQVATACAEALAQLNAE